MRSNKLLAAAGRLAVASMLLGLAASEVYAAQYYAATTGSPSGDGSIGNPWDLQTALNSGAPIGTVQPGDTVWVRGGVYLAPFTAYLKGSPSQPIIVRNYQGERAILDRQYFECNPSVCPPAQWQAAHPWYPACPGAGGSIHNLQCNGYGTCDPTGGFPCTAPFNSTRDALFIPKTTHDLWIWGIEMTDLGVTTRSHIPAFCTAANPPPGCCYPGGYVSNECDGQNLLVPKSLGSPIEITGDRIKLINSALHDAAVSFEFFSASEDSEVYGSLSFHAGYAGALRGMHHGCYVQNFHGLDHVSDKALRETIFFNNYGLGAQIYGSCGPVDNMLVEGVVSFSTTVPAKEFYATQDPAILSESLTRESQDSILIGAGRSSHRVRVVSTYVYNPIDSVGMPSFDNSTIPMRLTNIYDAAVEDSVFVGDSSGVRINDVAQLRFHGNTVIGRLYYPGQDGQVTLYDAHQAQRIPLHEFSQNSYYRTDGPPQIGIVEGGGGLAFAVSLANWQSIYGKDLDSNGYTGKPFANQVFVRPNAYESGRGHVIIYNWANLSSVPVDLSPLGLSHGQGFKVHNIQSFKTDPMAADWMGNVAASGTFDSGNPSVNVDMTDTTVSIPIGSTLPLPSTLPEFGVFVVLPQ